MSALQAGLVWWAAQLRDLLPARLRAGGDWSDLHGDALIADARPHEPDLVLTRRRNRRESNLGPADPARLRATAGTRRVLLRVSGGAVLERPMTLPLATEPELDRVVAYEIDRISPFTAAELAWTFEVVQRDRALGKLSLRIALLPRAVIGPALETLRASGVVPSVVIAPRADGGTWRIALAPPVRAPARRAALVLAATACLVLAIAATALPFIRQQAALDREDARIASLRPAVAEADTLRRRVADRASGLDALAAEAARTGRALDMLGTLTGLLPDDTYLTGLSMRQRALTLSGRSASAARLIPLLAADPSIRNPGFAAPVTRGEGARGDVFSIRAEFGS